MSYTSVTILVCSCSAANERIFATICDISAATNVSVMCPKAVITPRYISLHLVTSRYIACVTFPRSYLSSLTFPRS